MKSILSFVTVFVATNPHGAYQTLRQGSPLQGFLLNADCAVLNLWSALAAVALIALTFVLTRRRYAAPPSDPPPPSEQRADYAATVERQQRIIDEQHRQLHAQHFTSEQQSVQDTKHLASIYQELKLANQDIEIFLYKAYHNFLGPIATIRGICNVAIMESKEVSSLDYFDKVSAVADNMHSMLEQLLEVSVIHDRDLAIEPINLLTFCTSIEHDLSESTTYSAVQIRHQFSATDQLLIDDFLLRQAIVKIINNTAPFRRAGFRDVLELTISCEEQDEAFVVTLKDYHLSVPSEVSSDIFRMFYRGTQQANDHGLGLYTARYAMRRMGGDIDLISGSNYTTFGLRVPKRSHHHSSDLLKMLVNEG